MTQAEQASPADSHEAIHLPPPSIWPAVLALGIALLLTGLVLNLILLIVGLVISVAATALWVRDARREFDALPE
jgi:hypothetical protein